MKRIKNIISMCLMAGMISCASEPHEKIEGTYVRESSSESKNTNTEKVLGNVYFRDTIFITKKKVGYQIDNSKWRMNDFDNEGWRNMAHSDNRPMLTYPATYDETDQSLNPENALFGKIIYLDFEKGIISLNKEMKNPWEKLSRIKIRKYL